MNGKAINNDVHNARSLTAILKEMRGEVQEFARTRIELLKRELRENAATLKMAIPLAAVGGLFLTTAFLLFSFALVALIATALADNPYRWFFGSLAIALLWACLGAIALYSLKRKLSHRSMLPKKTIEVLSGDKVWLQNEARSTL